MSVTTSPHTNKSTGITHQIRLKLNFNDEKLWKRFSSRRLELIDSMRLSNKKASEQDDEIMNCSKILMNEFNYANEENLSDFVKLVRVAIQSVRRNRKRSTKSKNSKGTSNNSGTTNKFVMVKQVSTPLSDDEYSSDNDEEKSSFKLTDVLKTDEANHHYTYGSSTTDAQSSRLPINSLLQPVLPRSKNSFTKLPSFASLLVDDEFGSQANSPQGQHHHHHHQSSADLQQAGQQFFSNKELIALNKLLSLIKRSRTCNDLSLDLQNSSTNSTISSSFYENLEVLGSTMILSTISYIFEKFFINLNPSSISYLRLKLNNDFTLSKILKTLDLSLNEYYHNDFVSAQTFKRLIGCCVKDFGFDTVISPLTDIIHEIILKDYPLISKNSSSVMSSSSPALSNSHPITIPSPTASIITTTSIPRQRRYSNEMISVELKFNSNSLNFKFNPKTSSKPTFLELLENSKDAFNIQSKHVFLKNIENLELIKNDDDVFKIFENCLNGCIKIGVFISEASEQKRESPLDTLSNAAEVVESRSKENNITVDDDKPLTNTTNTAPPEEKIVFQPLL